MLDRSIRLLLTFVLILAGRELLAAQPEGAEAADAWRLRQNDGCGAVWGCPADGRRLAPDRRDGRKGRRDLGLRPHPPRAERQEGLCRLPQEPPQAEAQGHGRLRWSTCTMQWRRPSPALPRPTPQSRPWKRSWARTRTAMPLPRPQTCLPSCILPCAIRPTRNASSRRASNSSRGINHENGLH